MQKEANNIVRMTGTITENFTFNHEMLGEKFYRTFLEVKRRSGASDILPMVVSERMVDVCRDWIGRHVEIEGQIRSYNHVSYSEGRKNKLILNVFVTEWKQADEKTDFNEINEIELFGTICKEPIYRETSLGREVTDVLIAVNRSYGKSDYIPCICWGRSAMHMGMQDVGTKISLKGRFQSRNYNKRLCDGTVVTRTAYEVSMSSYEVIRNEED